MLTDNSLVDKRFINPPPDRPYVRGRPISPDDFAVYVEGNVSFSFGDRPSGGAWITAEV